MEPSSSSPTSSSAICLCLFLMQIAPVFAAFWQRWQSCFRTPTVETACEQNWPELAAMNPIGWFTIVSSSSQCKPRLVHTTRGRLPPKSESLGEAASDCANFRLVNPASLGGSPRQSELPGSGEHLPLGGKTLHFYVGFCSFHRLTIDLNYYSLPDPMRDVKYIIDRSFSISIINHRHVRTSWNFKKWKVQTRLQNEK